MSCNCNSENNSCLDIVPIFSSLNEEEQIKVSMITDSRQYKKDEIIYNMGESNNSLYVIHKGNVKISRITEDGKEQVIRILNPGDFLGELSIFSKELTLDTAQAISEVVICQIQGEKLKGLMLEYPSISIKVVGELSNRLKDAETTIERIGVQTVDKRIAEKLLELSKEKDTIQLDRTKGILASELGITQETLSRKLSLFQKNGWIDMKGHRIIIINKKKELEGVK